MIAGQMQQLLNTLISLNMFKIFKIVDLENTVTTPPWKVIAKPERVRVFRTYFFSKKTTGLN